MSVAKPIRTPLGLKRPSLEFRFAFDYCAMHLHQRNDSAILLASSPLYAYEMMHRLQKHAVMLIPTADWAVSDSEPYFAAHGCSQPPMQTLQSHVEAVKTIVWAGPLAGDVDTILEKMSQMLAADGKLYVIVGGRLSRFLGHVLHFDDQAVPLPLNYRQVTQALGRHGWQGESMHGFHGVVSIFWSYAFRLMTALGQPHWADRCLYRMRATYAVGGWQKALTTLNVIVADKRL